MKISFDKTKKIGVAVSGGIDSMVLLDLIFKQSKNIVVINIEHGIRGEESIEDSAFVEKYANNLGIQFISKSVDAIEYSKEKNMSVELAARELRYKFFNSLLDANIVDYIALAHHLDDQAETILMRIFRGTGVRGLRGIVDRIGYIHPLISIPKSDIEEYARKNSIPYVHDHTNFESEYTRNYIRNEIMPLITKRNKEVLSSFDTLSKNAIELEDYLLSRILDYKVIDKNNIYLPIDVFAKHPLIFKKSVIEALRYFGVERDVEYVNLEEIQKLKLANNNSIINLPFDIVAIKEYDKLVLSRVIELEPFCEDFDISKEYKYARFVYTFIKSDPKAKSGYIDADKLPSGLKIRVRENGDMFKPYNGPTQLLSDYLTNKKIPNREREEFLVLAKDNEVKMILGIEICDDIKITKNTKNAYFVQRKLID